MFLAEGIACRQLLRDHHLRGGHDPVTFFGNGSAELQELRCGHRMAPVHLDGHAQLLVVLRDRSHTGAVDYQDVRLRRLDVVS